MMKGKRRASPSPSLSLDSPAAPPATPVTAHPDSPANTTAAGRPEIRDSNANNALEQPVVKAPIRGPMVMCSWQCVAGSSHDESGRSAGSDAQGVRQPPDTVQEADQSAENGHGAALEAPWPYRHARQLPHEQPEVEPARAAARSSYRCALGRSSRSPRCLSRRCPRGPSK